MTTLCIIFGIVFLVMIYLSGRSAKKYWKFKSLKPGDVIRVTIHGISEDKETCECRLNATVLGHSGKYVCAEIDQEGKEISTGCSKICGMNCWNNVSMFDLYDVII